jgi:hypothetical protein
MLASPYGVGVNRFGAIGGQSVVFIYKREGGWIMSERVPDVFWSMLAGAGVKRCYGIVGDALNPSSG